MKVMRGYLRLCISQLKGVEGGQGRHGQSRCRGRGCRIAMCFEVSYVSLKKINCLQARGGGTPCELPKIPISSRELRAAKVRIGKAEAAAGGVVIGHVSSFAMLHHQA